MDGEVIVGVIRPAFVALTVLIALFCALVALAVVNGHGTHHHDHGPHAGAVHGSQGRA